MASVVAHRARLRDQDWAQRLAPQHVAHAAGVIKLTGGREMLEGGQLACDGPQATLHARLRLQERSCDPHNGPWPRG